MSGLDLGMKLVSAVLSAAVALGASACTVSAPEDLADAEGELGSAQQATVTSQCLNYQRGVVGSVADATLWESAPNYNSGTYTQLNSGTSSGGFKQPILNFDISNIPAGARVESATLSLYMSWKETSSNVGIHEILASWDEATVTSGSFDESYDPTPSTTFLAWGGGGQLQISIKALVQKWVNGDSENHGLLLQDDGATLYRSSEHDIVSSRPKLKVCYTLL